MHIVHVNLAFRDVVDAEALLDRFPTLTRLCETQAKEPGVRVTSFGRFSRDVDVVRNGVRYLLRVDDEGRQLLPPLGRAPKLTALVKDLTPDVVHANGFMFPRELLALRRASPNAALVVQHHGGGPGGVKSRLVKRLAKRAADGYFFTADGLAEPWRRAGILPRDRPVFEVIEGSSDFKRTLRETARERTGVDGEPAVLWVKRLHPLKDPETALEAFARAFESLPAARLHMVYGESQLLPLVEAIRARSPLLSERIRFIGEKPHAELADWFSAADIFLTSSLDEGSNYSLIEAMSCGLFPVASDIPPHRKLTKDGAFGCLFPPGDVAAAADALVSGWERVRTEGESLKCDVRAHFEASLSWDAIARQSLTAYRTLLAERRGPHP